MSRAKCIMVQGTMSGAGKSLLCTALCRIFAQDGYRVAPFKSQNMALNSFVTRDGLEMGRAQVVQAQAAGMEPDVRMNPILLKPSSDVGSQVIVNGEVRGQMPAAAYFKLKKSLIPEILAAYDSLAEEVDIIVIEGAGSPAEINLKADDIVNMGLAKLVDAPVLLAGDIDRGGVFAQLYGTVELLEPAERARIKGLVINKFRGDAAILKPGLTMLEEKTHLPVLGVVPYLRVDIEDEDSLSSRLESSSAVKPLDAAILRLPHISNFTDFMPLEQHPLLSVRYVQSPRQLGAPDVVILPGTKNTIDDLLWLRQCGLEAAVQKLATSGTPVLGVCGGYQMLGETLADPEGTESGRSQTVRGLGLLPIQTVFTDAKHRTQDTATVTAPQLAGAVLTGYQIHTGRTAVQGVPFCRLADGSAEGCVKDNVAGTYLHGLFDTGELTEKLVQLLCSRKDISPASAPLLSMAEYRQQQFDLLADGVRRALDMNALYAAMGLEGRNTAQHHLPADIERTSLSIITAELDAMGLTPPPETAAVVKRVIHTTADFDYARNLRFTPGAVAAGVAALQTAAPIVTDTNMALSGITKPGLARLGGTALCYMADPEVAALAKTNATTRAVASMQRAAAEHPGAILAVGNAPTALLTIADLIETAGLRPALVIGVPVGFVNVVESKERLFEVCTAHGVPAIVAMGRKGGSNVAAAICNALVYSAAGMLDPTDRGWK